MLSAILSFFGGSVFRMLWGEVSSFFTKRQDHTQELERMKLQGDLDAQTHQRQLENLRLQNELGVRTVEIQRDSAIAQSDADAFTAAIANFKPTGISWVDAWNASVRPQYAEVALVLWIIKVAAQSFVMDDFDITLAASIVGFFFADRTLARRGK